MSGGTFGGGRCARGAPSDSDQPAGLAATLIRDQEGAEVVLCAEIRLRSFTPPRTHPWSLLQTLLCIHTPCSSSFSSLSQFKYSSLVILVPT